MEVRFHIDPDTAEPHVYNHGVSEDEVIDVLRDPGEDRAGYGGARVSIGQTRGGRYLKVIYVEDREAEDIFVVTAYELTGKARLAYRRRRRRRS